jgi:hypothetical protein
MFSGAGSIATDVEQPVSCPVEYGDTCTVIVYDEDPAVCENGDFAHKLEHVRILRVHAVLPIFRIGAATRTVSTGR